jgi:lysophospholipase L1-like esterase
MLKQHGIAEFKNLGVSSTTIRDWSDNDYPEGKAFEAAMATYQPNVVFIILGTNEEAWRKNRPTWDVTAQRKPAIERMRRKLGSVRSIYLGMPPHHLWPIDRKYRDFLQTTWGEDFFRTEDVAPQKSGDGIHLSAKGYDQWVAAIDAWLTARGA